MCLPCLQSFVLQTAHPWDGYSLHRNKYPDEKSTHEHTVYLPHQKVQPEAGMTKAALILPLNHPINTWVVNRSWEHCPRGQRLMFSSYSIPQRLRTPKRTEPTDDFQLWFCNTSQLKVYHKAPKSNYVLIMVRHFFFRKKAMLLPYSLTIITLDTIPSIGISFKSKYLHLYYRKGERDKKLKDLTEYQIGRIS